MREIRLYGPIGRGYDVYSGVRMLDEAWLLEELELAAGDEIELLINSDGGSVFTAKTMMEELARYEGTVTAIVTGLAASAATFLPMAADSVLIAPGAQMMIHDPWTFAAGNERELMEAAAIVAGVRENTVMPAYLERMKGTTANELRAMLDAETWLSSDESVSIGLADGLSRESGVKALVRPDRFKSRLPDGAVVPTDDPNAWRTTCLDMRRDITVGKTRRIASRVAMTKAWRREAWEKLDKNLESI